MALTPEQQEAIERAQRRIQGSAAPAPVAESAPPAQPESDVPVVDAAGVVQPAAPSLTTRQRVAIQRARARAEAQRTPVRTTLRDFNTGLLGIIPGTRSLLGDTGMVRPPGAPPSSIAGAGAEAAGEALTLAGGGVAALGARAARLGPQMLRTLQTQPGIAGGVERVLGDVAATAARRPGAFFGTEALGGFGVGAGAASFAEDGESEIVGGLVGGTAASAIPGSVIGVGRRAVDATAAAVTPFLPRGAEVRAARRLQSLSSDPAADAARVAEARDGISPARATGNERLMALEQRILKDSPELDDKVRQDLLSASVALREELADAAGVPRSEDAWRQAVMQRIAAPGADIPQGLTDEMLDAAYDSFEPLYAPARAAQVAPAIRVDGQTVPLRAALRASVEDRAIFASRGERRDVSSWLDNQLTAVTDRADEAGQVSAGDLLDLRSVIRDQGRRAAKRGDDIARELFAAAENRVTQALDTQLPDEAAQTLRKADELYGRYKVVESATFRAGERELSPQMLSEAIRRESRNPSQYARGRADDLRQLALAGRDPNEFIGNPRLAARVMRGADPAAQATVQDGFVQALVRRATRQDLDETGAPVVSGEQLERLLTQNADVMRSLGMDDNRIGRVRRIATELSIVQRPAPGPADGVVTDTPATVLRLIATLVGAKSGQRISSVGPGNGLGSGLVLSQFMAERARDALTRLTRDRAEGLLIQAQRDPELYRALLTRASDSDAQKRAAAQTLSAWLVPALDQSDEE